MTSNIYLSLFVFISNCLFKKKIRVYVYVISHLD